MIAHEQRGFSAQMRGAFGDGEAGRNRLCTTSPA
jgi:hypothetical protein